ncbi:hypothetical protein FSP39_009563 [Pinctada imbricata]|uniref:B box-type domain-containing protein n=1 Tax=Pinctada imbricata TaxID=66713 RepID=A0AA89C542_PINIB|nr:hypothetical protein FSP39_009563 [Pinctada imbricata]
MTSSLYKAQFALRLCDIHDKKELHAYCKTCKIKICSSCIKEDHTSHDWETITDILREKRRSLPEECKEIRSKQLPGLKKELISFDRKIEKEDAQFQQNKSTLNVSRQSYINEINRLFDRRVEECQQKSESAIQLYKEKREGLKLKVEYLDMMTISLDKDINTLPDHDILDMEQEMKDELQKALSYRANKHTCTTVFKSGQMDIQALENMIGEIHNISVEEMNDMNRFSELKMVSLKSVSDSNAWVRFDEDHFAKLINRAGDVLKTMKTSCTDLIISNSGEFVLTKSAKCKISVLSEDGNTTGTFDTTPLKPSYVSRTGNDEILVTLRDTGDDYNLVPTSRRIVQRMTLTGKVLHTYEFREDGITRLFTWPVRTTENKNMDICVINWLKKGNGELVVLNKDGRVKFTYAGNGLSSDKFNPYSVECDHKCRILLTEPKRRAIHMLSSEGIYLCTLSHYENLRPYSISMYGESLWCGMKEGSMKVFRYKY